MMTKMKLSLFFAVLLGWCAGPAALGDARPNILVILVDDLGYADAGFTGSKEILTPRLDALAQNGMIFENGYVTHPYCGPSRAGLMAGRYQARFGMEINVTYSPYDLHSGFPLSEKTIAERLKPTGYRTGIIGKWHLGASQPFHPNNRGFDHFYGFLSGGHTYLPENVTTTTPLLLENGNPHYSANEGGFLPLMRNDNAGEFTEYLTTALSRDAAEFVKQGPSASSGQARPFFLYLSYNAPHGPLEAPQETVAKYKHIEDWSRRTYAAMVDEMDQGIGMVVDALKESGKLDNTLIFFLSDNGGVAPKKGHENENWADNGKFKSGKGSMHEGGSHVPFFLHWPDGIPTPGTFDGLVSSLDIAATAVALAGGDTSGHPLEGINLAPYVSGEKTGSPHAALYWRIKDGSAWCVRTPDGKYLKENWGKGLALYDMKNDPYESTNLLGEAPELQAELARLWNDWNENNVPNVLLQAGEYQKKRLKMYGELYKSLQEKAKKTQPVVIQ